MVFVVIQPRKQLAVFDAGIVAGGYHVRAVFQGSFQKQLELYLLVAHDVRIRRLAGLVFAHHVIHDFAAVLLFEIVRLEGMSSCTATRLASW